MALKLVKMSLAIVNKRLLTAWNKGISSNGKGQKILTKVRIFLKVISEICSVMGTIVSKYEPELVKNGVSRQCDTARIHVN